MSDHNPEILTAKEAAVMLRMHVDRLRSLTSAGRFPGGNSAGRGVTRAAH